MLIMILTTFLQKNKLKRLSPNKRNLAPLIGNQKDLSKSIKLIPSKKTKK